MNNSDNPLNNIRKCFQPRSWFKHCGEVDPNVLSEEDSLMWVYKVVKTEDTSGKLHLDYHVGYFMPDGTWQCDSVYNTKEEASCRVNYLNGGKVT